MSRSKRTRGDLPTLTENHLRRLTSAPLLRLLDTLQDGPISLADAKRITRRGRLNAMDLLRSVHGVLIDLDTDAGRVAALVRWPALPTSLGVRRLLAEGVSCSHIRGILAAHIAGPITSVTHLARVTGMSRHTARDAHACLKALDLLATGAPNLGFEAPSESTSARANQHLPTPEAPSLSTSARANQHLPTPEAPSESTIARANQHSRGPEAPSLSTSARANQHLPTPQSGDSRARDSSPLKDKDKDIDIDKKDKTDPPLSLNLSPPSFLDPNSDPDHPEVPEPVAVLTAAGVEPDVAAGLLAWHPVEVELLTAAPNPAAVGLVARNLLVNVGVYPAIAQRCWERRPGRTLEVVAMLNTLIARPEIYGVDHEAGPGLWSDLIEVDEHGFLARARELRQTQPPPHAGSAREMPVSETSPTSADAEAPEPAPEPEPDAPGAEPAADGPARMAWQRAQAALALQLTASEYDTLVGPCRYLSCEDGELKLLVPNSVARDLLGNRLRPWLKEHLAQLLGEYVDVHLILDTGAATAPVPDVAGRLVEEGVYPHLAGKLVRDHGPEVCRAALERLDDQRRQARIAQPGPWLVGAIREAARVRDGEA